LFFEVFLKQQVSKRFSIIFHIIEKKREGIIAFIAFSHRLQGFAFCLPLDNLFCSYSQKKDYKKGNYPRAPKAIKKAFTAFEGINPSRDNSLVLRYPFHLLVFHHNKLRKKANKAIILCA